MEIFAVETCNINEEKLRELCLTINKEKGYRIKRFVNKEDKIRTVIGEILIRITIIKKLNIKNSNIKFNKNLYGKPYLEKWENFHFNISHSGKFVICAIDDKPIGIDIEEIKWIDFKDIMESYFTKEEIRYISKNELDTCLNKFYEIWTLKESYIKCRGGGLAIPLKSFSINIDKFNNIEVDDYNDSNKYILKTFNLGIDYKVALCSLNESYSGYITIIEQDSLINNYISTIKQQGGY